MFGPNRQLPDPLTGCMIDCVGDGGRGPGNPDFTHSARTDRIELQLGTVEKLHVNRGNVRVGRKQILRKFTAGVPPVSSVVLTPTLTRPTVTTTTHSHIH